MSDPKPPQSPDEVPEPEFLGVRAEKPTASAGPSEKPPATPAEDDEASAAREVAAVSGDMHGAMNELRETLRALETVVGRLPK